MSPQANRRNQLRDAALRVFARKGYRNTVVEDVADEAGVGKGTVYTYFDRKEELLGAVFEGHLQELRARQEEIFASDRHPLEKIRALHSAFIQQVAADEAFARVLPDIWVAGMQDPERFGIDFKSLYAEYRGLVRQLLEEAAERGDLREDLPELAPAVFIGAIEGVLLQWVLDPEGVDFPAAADDIIDVLYRGIQASGTERPKDASSGFESSGRGRRSDPS